MSRLPGSRFDVLIQVNLTVIILVSAVKVAAKLLSSEESIVGRIALLHFAPKPRPWLLLIVWLWLLIGLNG